MRCDSAFAGSSSSDPGFVLLRDSADNAKGYLEDAKKMEELIKKDVELQGEYSHHRTRRTATAHESM